MDSTVLDRFVLPGDLRHHSAVARGAGDERSTRINSVMPKVVSRVNAFRCSLRPREKHGFDVEDVLQELWLELIVKDRYFDAARSKYITFAIHICEKKLGEIRNRWHTVCGPKDTAARLRAAALRDDAGAERVRQTVRETSSLAAEPADLLDGEHTAQQEAEREEGRRRAIGTIREALAALALRRPQLAALIGLFYDLEEGRPAEVGQIANAMGLTVAQTLAMKSEAERELRRAAVRLTGANAIIDLGNA